MTVRCAKCGEELLGSVNRCWRCGESLQSHAGPIHVPPVRRTPISVLDPIVAEAVDESAVMPAGDMPSALASGKPPMRRGSPFAAIVTRPPPEHQSGASGPASSRAVGGIMQLAGTVSIFLALVAIGLCYAFPIGSAVISLAAVGFAILGTNAPNRRVGIGTLIFCCIALALSVFLASLEVYESIYGVNPFSPPAPLPPLNP